MSGYTLDPKYDGSKVLYIDSRDADVYLERRDPTDPSSRPLTTNFLYTLREKLVVPDDQVALVSLYNATIPHSFYNVREGINDKIPFSVSYGTRDGGPIYTDWRCITLDDGNYTPDELIQQIIYGNDTPSSKIATEGNPFLPNKYIGYDDMKFLKGTSALMATKYNEIAPLTIFFNEPNGTLRYELESHFDGVTPPSVPPTDFFRMTFTWDSAPAYPTTNEPVDFIGGYEATGTTEHLANAICGFRGTTDFPDNLTADSEQVYPNKSDGEWEVNYGELNDDYCCLQSQQVVDLNDNIHGLFLRQNLVSKSTLTTQTSLFSNVLARIPITAPRDEIIYFTPNDATHQCLVDLKTIDTLGIRLTDDMDRTLDLGGLYFQMGLLIQFVEKTNIRDTPLSRHEIDEKLAVAKTQQALKIKKSSKASQK